MIIALGGPAVRALKPVAGDLPIVMSIADDPVREGFVSSFARPGGNLTGVVSGPDELGGKRLQLLHEAVPTARRVAALVRPSRFDEAGLQTMRSIADTIGIEIIAYRPEASADYPAAFASMRADGAQALTVFPGGFDRDAAMLAKLALDARLPTVCPFAFFARFGCLLGYGASTLESRRRLADYVARILQGATPGELPIEQPNVYELSINLPIARALGITIPANLLARADEVIE